KGLAGINRAAVANGNTQERRGGSGRHAAFAFRTRGATGTTDASTQVPHNLQWWLEQGRYHLVDLPPSPLPGLRGALPRHAFPPWALVFRHTIRSVVPTCQQPPVGVRAAPPFRRR